MFKTKILVCVSDSENSRIAVKFACLKAKRLQCPLEILHVVNSIDLQNFMNIGNKIREDYIRQGEQLLEKYNDFAAEITPEVLVSLNLREGNSLLNQIITCANEDPSLGLILFGAGKKSQSKNKIIAKLIDELGSKIMIPVMIVPQNLNELQIHELV